MRRAAGAPQPSLSSPSSRGSAKDRPCPLLPEQYMSCQLFQTNLLLCPTPVCKIFWRGQLCLRSLPRPKQAAQFPLCLLWGL